MSNPSGHPRAKLSKLRDIGWTLWDPIGLLPPNVSWNHEQCRPFVDEYDGYLRFAAARLRDGAAHGEVVDYLVTIETEYMGLSERPTTRARAEATVAAIAAADGLWIWPDEQGRFSDQE
jgi:hypothetical protein